MGWQNMVRSKIWCNAEVRKKHWGSASLLANSLTEGRVGGDGGGRLNLERWDTRSLKGARQEDARVVAERASGGPTLGHRVVEDGVGQQG